MPQIQNLNMLKSQLTYRAKNFLVYLHQKLVLKLHPKTNKRRPKTII